MKSIYRIVAIMATLLVVGCNPTEPGKNGDKNKDATLGVFSVSEGEKVYFSPGNLQFQASTYSWRFAEHQYDFVGGSTYFNDAWFNEPIGNVYFYSIKCDNKEIAATYNGWIDLFGWGTGFNPVQSSDSKDDYKTFVDWGANKIGSDPANTWRTLSGEEWKYIIQNRPNSDSLYCHAIVNDINGLILLPDDWVAPEDMQLKVGTEFEYSDNVFSASQWDELEKNGAIFLPAAGYRNLASLYYTGVKGYYWSLSLWNDSGTPMGLHLGKKFVDVMGGKSFYGYSVRLVRNVK